MRSKVRRLEESTAGELVSGAFFRAFATISVLAAIGVLVAQVFLAPEASPTSTDGAIALLASPMYRARAWTILLQVFLMFLSLWAVAVKMHRRAFGLVATGFVVFLLWQVLELVPRSLDLLAGSYGWAADYVSVDPGDAGVRGHLEGRLRMLSDLTGALVETRRILWALGHLLFGLAIWRLPGWARLVAALFLANFARLVLGMVGRTVGPAWLAGGGVLPFVALIVPQFLAIALWLWREPRVELRAP